MGLLQGMHILLGARLVGALIAALYLVIGTTSLRAADAVELPAADTLTSGWNVIPADGICATGTPYLFHARPAAASDKLLIVFNGGGACWFGQGCDPAGGMDLYYTRADMAENAPAGGAGIFALDNPANPFRDYAVVDIPYCTGDVHVGTGIREYVYTNAAGSEVTVNTHHNGYANSMTVLQWIYRNYPAPAQIVITGSSAGAIGASFFAGLVAEHYGGVPVVLVADGAGGFNSPQLARTFEAWNTAAILPDWPAYAGETNQTLSFEDFYIASRQHAPNLTLAQVNSAQDQVQIDFTLLFGDPPDSFAIAERIFNHYVEIESAVAAFYHYTVPGSVHPFLTRPDFFTASVNGVRFLDWLNALLAGTPLGDVSCVDAPQGCGSRAGAGPR